MKSYRRELFLNVPTRRAFVNITTPVLEALRESGIWEGFALVCPTHITASVFITVGQYQHNRTGEDNADAHIKRQIMGREVVVAVTEGRLDFGTWEQIFYGEFDGRRNARQTTHRFERIRDNAVPHAC